MPVTKQDSRAQEAFLAKRKQTLRTISLSRILIFLAFLLLWEISTRLGWIDGFIFSSPTRVWNTFLSMVFDGTMFLHIGTTLAETLISFLLVFLISLTAAVALWLSPSLSKICEPYLVVLNSLPKSALAPLLIVWLGANIKTIIVAGISVAIFGSILTIHTGFSEVDPEKIKLIHTLGGKKRDVLWKVVLPSSIPIFINTMKVNIGLCLVGVIIGDGVKSEVKKIFFCY